MLKAKKASAGGFFYVKLIYPLQIAFGIMSILRFIHTRLRKSHSSVTAADRMTDPQKAHSASELVPLLSHPSGYVREAAALRAKELLLPDVLPHLMPRVNDWVPEVRSAAFAAFDAYMQADRFDDVLRSLAYVYGLNEYSRHDHREFIERIEHFLTQHERANEIPALVNSSGFHARSLFGLSWKYKLALKAELVRIGLISEDISIKRRACRAITQLPEAECLAIGRQLLKAKSGWMRYEGLKAVAAIEPAEAKEWAESFLLAQHTLLRELSEKLTEKTAGELALLRHDVLRRNGEKPRLVKLVIKRSGQLKDKSCESLLAPYLAHENLFFRGAALLALARISPHAYDASIHTFLASNEPPLVGGAVQAALESGLSLSPQEWETCIRKTHNPFIFLRLAAFARKVNKWVYLGMLLEAGAQHKFPDIIALQLKAWVRQFNKSFEPPAEQQSAWIRKNLPAYAGASPSAADIAFYMP